MILSLHWKEISERNKIDLSIKAKGIYLWGFTIDNEFIPYYVGKAEDIQYRLCEHLNCTVGGKYTIYHKDCLKDFTEYRNKPIEKESGKLYHPDWPKSFAEFLNMSKHLLPQTHRSPFLYNGHFFTCKWAFHHVWIFKG